MVPTVRNPGTTPITILAANSDWSEFRWEETRTMVWVSFSLQIHSTFEFWRFKFSVVWVLVWVSSFGGGSRTVKTVFIRVGLPIVWGCRNPPAKEQHQLHLVERPQLHLLRLGRWSLPRLVWDSRLPWCSVGVLHWAKNCDQKKSKLVCHYLHGTNRQKPRNQPHHHFGS